MLFVVSNPSSFVNTIFVKRSCSMQTTKQINDQMSSRRPKLIRVQLGFSSFN